MKKKEKAFNNWKHNAIHLTFPNGNALSTIWGAGTYCENYNLWRDSRDLKFLDSNSVEIMIIKAPQKLINKINRKYGDCGDVIGYLKITQWLDIVNMLAK